MDLACVSWHLVVEWAVQVLSMEGGPEIEKDGLPDYTQVFEASSVGQHVLHSRKLEDTRHHFELAVAGQHMMVDLDIAPLEA